MHGLPSRSSRWLLAAPVRLRPRFAQATPDTLRPDGLRMAAPRVARLRLRGLRPPVRLRFRFTQARPDTLRPDGLRMAAPRVARLRLRGLRPPVRLRFRFTQARPDTLRPDGLRMAAPRVARQGEAWWACLDSNQEPDRYERPALTIELQAPPQTAARFEGGQRCRQRLQGDRRSGNAAASPPKRRRTRPPCAIFRSPPRSACRIHPGSAASAGRQSRQAAPPAWGP